MKWLFFSSAAFLLSACTINLHIHESPKPIAAPEKIAEAAPAAAVEPAAAEESSDSLSGIVVDVQGQPVQARVAAVGSTGSVANSSNAEGRFELSRVHWPEIVVNATTKDGRVAVTPAHAGAKNLQLVLQPGATLVIDVDGRDHTRCAIFEGDQRIEDFTLRKGKPANVVVPPGDVRVRLYDGDKIYKEELLSAAVGTTKTVSFKLDS